MESMIGMLDSQLSKAGLLGSESVRDSERTTKFEIQSVLIKELEGALGGLYTPIADYQQVPLVHRLEYQIVRDKIARPLPPEAVQLEVLTGIAALSKGAQISSLLNIVQAAQALGPEAMAKIDARVLLDVLARNQNVYEPGIIKTNAQVDAEKQQQMQQALAAAAAQQGIQSAGAIAVNRLSDPTAPSAPR